MDGIVTYESSSSDDEIPKQDTAPTQLLKSSLIKSIDVAPVVEHKVMCMNDNVIGFIFRTSFYLLCLLIHNLMNLFIILLMKNYSHHL